MNALVVAVVLLWVLVLGLVVVVFALARQIGLLHERIAPVGALATRGGPEVGEAAPRVAGRLLGGGLMMIGEALPAGRARLLLFVSSDCPVCKRLIPLAKSVAKAEGLELVFVGDADEPAQRALVARFDLAGYAFVNGPEVGMAFQIGKLPYGVLLDETGVIAAKGLVNTREHLESLVIARNTGFDSIQSYLSGETPRAKPVSAGT